MRPSPQTVSPLTLPPPTFDASVCAAGDGGEHGCRRCVEACPYLAMRPIGTPEGTVIHIDAGLCRRCGACTGVCPTGALDRSFLPDDELMALLGDAMTGVRPGSLLVLAGAEQHELLAAMALPRPFAALTLPSLLILNENHLLHAARQGAAGIAVVGSLFSHHGTPALVQNALTLSEALGGVPTTYVEAGDPERVTAALEAFAETLPAAEPKSEPTPAPTGRRREQLAALLDAPVVSDAAVDAAFGEVTVEADGCTLCGACARACPTDALSFDPTGGELTFEPLSCVGCGLCQEACPERVLSLSPGLPVGVNLTATQTLVEDDVSACVSCGAPHLPERLLRAVRALLEGRTDLPPEATEIDRCPACRTIGVVRPDSEGDDAVVALPVLGNPAGGGSPIVSSGAGCGGNCGCGGSGAGSGSSTRPATRQDHEVAFQSSSSSDGVARRSFLKGLGTAVSGLVALSGGQARAQAAVNPADALPPPQRRMGMAIDLEKCIGCHACTVACKAENDVPLGVFRDWVEEHLLGTYPTARPYFLPKLCNQCDDPGCLRVCPTGAIFRRVDGIVDLDPDICIGCRACNQGCPYGMTFMNPERGTADKCNFCAHRVDEGLDPACVDVCPANCRIFGDLNDPDSPVSEYIRDRQTQVLRRDLGLSPNVRYVSLPAELNR